MKSDNIFRFVSLRPPLRADPTTHQNPREDQVGPDVIRELERAGDERDPDAARKHVGEAIVSAEDYYGRDRDWARLRPFAARFFALGRLAQEEERQAFLRETEALFREVYGDDFSLQAFLVGELFARLKAKAWRSYYGNVLAVTKQPADRGPLSRWLTFFWLLEAANEDDFRQRAQRLGRARPSVPGEFFQPVPERRPAEPAPGEGAERPEEEEEHPRLPTPLDRLREKLERLGAARGFLQELFSTKLVSFKNLEIRAGPAARLAAAGVREPAGRAASQVTATSFDLIREAPWQAGRDDLERGRQHLPVLAELGLSTEDVRIPDAIDRIEREMAEVNTGLAQLMQREEVVATGLTLSRVTRMTRP